MKKRYAVIAGMAFAIPFGAASSVHAADAASQAAASWATMDANTDGALSPEEVSATPWQAKFDAMDANGDGKATKKEFKGYMANMKKTQKQHKASNGNM
ncbi:hypothetical protein [Salinisphaera aquimarina]|uniref:EF-hand domain-containing protein n=1 Tax=Salinisphaera aquimarina TaxID=2094031 RepID=A0ABV7EI29_9GAMM